MWLRRHSTARAFFSLCFALSVAAGLPSRAATNLNSSEQALMQGRVDEAVTQLRAALKNEPGNGAAHLLLCRAFLSEEFADQAVTECESAVSILHDSMSQDWLGRAYGLKADRSGPFAGYGLAKKVRDAFEAAVRLDPHSGDAFDDLGEYYVEAPGIVGGGLDKATSLAAQGAGVLPGRARVLRAMIAEKQKDFGTAEREFRTATQDGGTPDAWIDLGRFYGRRKQNTQATDAIKHAIEIDAKHDNSLAHAAEALMKMKLQPNMAIDALRAYLGGPLLSDSAPACKAHTNLGKLLAASGDKAGAALEFQKALSLAAGYAPARKELSSL